MLACPDTHGSTALIRACNKGMTEVVKLLVERGADVGTKTTNGNTALKTAVHRHHTQLTAYLWTKGGIV